MITATCYDKALAELAAEAELHDADRPVPARDERMRRHRERALVFAVLDLGKWDEGCHESLQRIGDRP